MGKKKSYVVFVGSNPGVYGSWEAAHTQVNKYSGACHKSYRSQEEAVRSFDSYKEEQRASFTPTCQTGSSSAWGSTSTVSSSSSQNTKPTKN